MRFDRSPHAIVRLFGVVACCAMALAACGGSGGTSSSSTDLDPPPPAASAGASNAAGFVCDTIRTLRADFEGIEDDLTPASWINGFIAALGDAPTEGAYGEVVSGRADAAAAQLCPDDWAAYLARAQLTTLEGIDVQS